MKDNWKEVLKDAFSVPEPENKKAFLKNIRPREISNAEMMLLQVRYIRASVWVSALLIIALAILGSFMKLEGTQDLISVTMPFLAAVSVLETGRSRKYAMTEIEMATRFSLRSVIFARMAVLGIVYMLILCVASPVIAMAFGGKALLIAIHILIPYLITMSISLQVERSALGRRTGYTSLGVAALTSLFMVWIKNYDPKIVQNYAAVIESRGGVLILLLAAITVFEQWKTINNMEEFI